MLSVRAPRPLLLSDAFTFLAVGGAALGVGFFFSASTLFVNIHHFFIDSVVWRGDNAEFREMIAAKAELISSAG